MDSFYLGVDGGQSSTVALIANAQGRILGQGSGGPCNHAASGQGREKFFRAMGESLHLAGTQAGVDPRSTSFAAACLGFSGGPEDKIAHTRELITSAKFLITHDAEIALAGATAGEPGILVIAGTGSIAFARNDQGKTARTGGWGYLFGDEGGAFHLAREALRAALRMEEGWGPPTTLRQLLLHAGNADSANHLLHRLYADFDRTAFARLAPIVSSAATEGDPSAIAILKDSARHLAALAVAVNRILFNNGNAPLVSHVGGVFESPLLLNSFKQAIRDAMNVEPAAPLYPPAAGALLLALRMDGNGSQLSNLAEIKR